MFKLIAFFHPYDYFECNDGTTEKILERCSAVEALCEKGLIYPLIEYMKDYDNYGADGLDDEELFEVGEGIMGNNKKKILFENANYVVVKGRDSYYDNGKSRTGFTIGLLEKHNDFE